MAHAPLAYDYPFTPHVNTKTKNKFDVGCARNGKHEPKMSRVDVWLYISNRDRHCASCHESIKSGDLYGSHSTWRSSNYCRNCVTIPAYTKIYEVIFSIGKRTSLHPQGVIINTFAASKKGLAAYLRQLQAQNRKIKSVTCLGGKYAL